MGRGNFKRDLKIIKEDSDGDGEDDGGNCTWTKIVLFNRRARMVEVTATKLPPFSTRVVKVLA